MRPASPFDLVQRSLGGFGGKRKSSRAKPSGKREFDRDTRANCPTIAMNAGEFGERTKSDHHVL